MIKAVPERSIAFSVAAASAQAAIFDMDGTLLDSMHIWDDAGERYLRSIGIEPQEDIRETLRPLSLSQVAEHFIWDYSVSLSATEIMEGINGSLQRFYEEEAQLKPGVLSLLEAMKDAGIPMCVATATDRHLVEPALRRTGVLPYFREIFTCGEVGAGKDQPEIFLRASEVLGAEKERTVVFEDALYAAETAKGEGFLLAAVYDPSAEAQQEQLKAIADFYIADFRELF